MNLEKELEEYILKEVSVWNKEGNGEKFLPQNKYLNLCEAISIAKEYTKEACRKQREICADVIMSNMMLYNKNGKLSEPDFKIKDLIINSPLAIEKDK